MFYDKWEKIYLDISKDLKLDYEKEIKSAKKFNSILKEQKEKIIPERELKNIFFENDIIIFGAGPSLERSIRKYKSNIKEKVVITSDGATSALIKNNIYPDIIVTDLDGNVSDQIKANSIKSKIIIHSHGDNLDKINKYVRSFKKDIHGTIQINPKNFVFLKNYGGFTDGDRAVFIADHFKAKNIFLAGFDFNGKIGKYSFSEKKDLILKKKKLIWCKYLLEVLIEKNSNIKFLKP